MKLLNEALYYTDAEAEKIERTYFTPEAFEAWLDNVEIEEGARDKEAAKRYMENHENDHYDNGKFACAIGLKFGDVVKKVFEKHGIIVRYEDDVLRHSAYCTIDKFIFNKIFGPGTFQAYCPGGAILVIMLELSKDAEESLCKEIRSVVRDFPEVWNPDVHGGIYHHYRTTQRNWVQYVNKVDREYTISLTGNWDIPAFKFNCLADVEETIPVLDAIATTIQKYLKYYNARKSENIVRRGGEGMKRKLTEATVTLEIQQIIDCITLKDWQRAYYTEQSRLASMMNKITDPKKRIGRAAALFMLGRMKSSALKDFIDEAMLKAGEGRYQDVYRNLHSWLGSDFDTPIQRDDEELDTIFTKEYPEFDFSKIEDPNLVVNNLRDVSYEEMLALSPSFKQLEDEIGRPNIERDYVGPTNLEGAARDSYKWQRDHWEDTKKRHLAKRGAQAAFGGKQVFTYIDVEGAVEAINDDPELKTYFTNEVGRGSDVFSDENHISPMPLMDIFEYTEAFKDWLDVTYQIKVSNPQHVKGAIWGAGHPIRSKEFAFLDDESAWNAGDLRKEPLFQHLLKVTRTGISLTRNGARKVWYDFTKDIADAASIPFNCEEF